MALNLKARYCNWKYTQLALIAMSIGYYKLQLMRNRAGLSE